VESLLLERLERPLSLPSESTCNGSHSDLVFHHYNNKLDCHFMLLVGGADRDDQLYSSARENVGVCVCAVHASSSRAR